MCWGSNDNGHDESSPPGHVFTYDKCWLESHLRLARKRRSAMLGRQRINVKPPTRAIYSDQCWIDTGYTFLRLDAKVVKWCAGVLHYRCSLNGRFTAIVSDRGGNSVVLRENGDAYQCWYTARELEDVMGASQ